MKYLFPLPIRQEFNKSRNCGEGTAVGKDLTAKVNIKKLITNDKLNDAPKYTNEIARMQGFDAPTKLVSEEEFNLLGKAREEVSYRTVSPTIFKGKRMTAGEFAKQLYLADSMGSNVGGSACSSADVEQNSDITVIAHRTASIDNKL